MGGSPWNADPSTGLINATYTPYIEQIVHVRYSRNKRHAIDALNEELDESFKSLSTLIIGILCHIAAKKCFLIHRHRIEYPFIPVLQWPMGSGFLITNLPKQQPDNKHPQLICIASWCIASSVRTPSSAKIITNTRRVINDLCDKIIIMAGMAVFYVAGYLIGIEERL